MRCKRQGSLVAVKKRAAFGAVQCHRDRAPHRGEVVLRAAEQVRQGAAGKVLRDDHVGLALGAGAEEAHRMRVVHLQATQLQTKT